MFSVLNNGVTLVAKKVAPKPGDAFEISGFQVVNGCQTSHVLFNNRQHVTDDMYITIKLIETDDVDLSSSVIKATNSQSLVMKEAFATIKPYHKRLEDFFKGMNAKGQRFYYERRPHQFDDDESILNSEIVSAPLLIKSFVSVVLEQPHKVHYYYGQILRDYNSETNTLLFDENHHPGLYFISHLIYAKSREAASKRKLGAWSYHIALLVKKRLGTRLTVSDKLTDAKILEIISTVNQDFPSAVNDAIAVFEQYRFTKNDNMLPEKTEELLRLYTSKFLRSDTGATPLVISPPQVVAPQPLRNGSYLVSDLRTLGDNIEFNYGPIKHSLPYTESVSSPQRMKQARITIAGGKVIQIAT